MPRCIFIKNFSCQILKFSFETVIKQPTMHVCIYYTCIVPLSYNVASIRRYVVDIKCSFPGNYCTFFGKPEFRIISYTRTFKICGIPISPTSLRFCLCPAQKNFLPKQESITRVNKVCYEYELCFKYSSISSIQRNATKRATS